MFIKTLMLIVGFILFCEHSFALRPVPVPVPVPIKYKDPNLHDRATPTSKFSKTLIANGSFKKVKALERRACHRNLQLYYSAAAADPLETFLESRVVVNTLQGMQEKRLLSAEVAVQPWSGDFWAYDNGILGARFNDPQFNSFMDWLKKFQFVQARPASTIIAEHDPRKVALLSPSEKYDLLVGDTSGALTNSMWAQGKQYYDHYGKVEGWMGICHGWSAAAIMEPRPAKSVDVPSPDGQALVRLTPSELKGLVSYNWATNPYPSAFLGARCEKKNPARDQNGRIRDPECFDLNPATWHQAIVHKIGIQRRSFVMDATYDYEVWNYPVKAYSYTYFNPQTRKPTTQLQEAVTSKESFTADRYSKYRSPEARSFVGIAMKVGYLVETMADNASVDGPDRDVVRWVQYAYDLELDASGKIIGGEWYLEAHPDFIWSPLRSARPSAPLDRQLSAGEWQETRKPIPQKWASAAQQSSANGVILNTITQALLKLSH